MDKILFFLALAVSCTNANLIPEETNRISAGNIARDGQFPYAISLQEIELIQQTSLLEAHKCGGALITLQHALTAATCTYYFIQGEVVEIVPSRYRVYAGNPLLTGAVVLERMRNIANITVHPNHRYYPALLNDIAIITLVAPFSNSIVIPIPIATNNFVPPDFTLCTVAGWGAINITVPASNELRYTTKYIYNHRLCTTLYNSAPNILNIHPNMICAASYDIYSSGCRGDEGNALICDGQLTGILSQTSQCAFTSYPEVYTRVSNFTAFIRSVGGISGASNFKPEFGLLTLIVVIAIKIFS